MGSPTPSISGITHLRSKALASTILNIFCTFIEADVEQKIKDACIARAKRFACQGRAGIRILESKEGRPRVLIAPPHLFGDFLLFVAWKCGKLVEFRADQKRNGSLNERWLSDPVECMEGTEERTLLNPRACLYHSFTEFSVDLRERSNMNRMATASLHTRGSMFTNSR